MEVTVRSIQNEDDYNAALADVDGLMDAEPGTPEGARLDVLVTLIEAYEARAAGRSKGSTPSKRTGSEQIAKLLRSEACIPHNTTHGKRVHRVVPRDGEDAHTI